MALREKWKMMFNTELVRVDAERAVRQTNPDPNSRYVDMENEESHTRLDL